MAPVTSPLGALPRAGTFVEDGRLEFEPFSSRNACQEKDEQRGSQVLVHVYDLVAFEPMNRVTAPSSFPIGGALHAGVEVYGREWSFGGGQGRGAGVVCEVPRSNKRHRFRETVLLGRTHLSDVEVALLLGDLVERWQPQDYHWIHRNCLAFANDFCERLGVGRLPAWIDRFARGAGALDQGVRTLAEQANDVARTAQGAVNFLAAVGPHSCGRCVGGPVGHHPSQRGVQPCRVSMHEVIVDYNGYCQDRFEWPSPKRLDAALEMALD